MSAISSPLPAVDRDRPDAAFVQAVRERYPTEREIDWAFTRRTDRRAQGPFKAPSLDDLVGYLHKLLREKIVGGYEVLDPAWLGGGGSKLQMRFTLRTEQPLHGLFNHVLVLRMEPAESLNPSSRLREAQIITALKTTDAQLAVLRQAGVVGVRILDIVGGGQGLAGLEDMASRCAELGWHVQLGAKGENYPALLPRLMSLKVPFVIDHMGWCTPSAGLQHPHFQAVLALARHANCRIKLSGAFRLSTQGGDWADTIPMAQALIDAAPDRVFWGSDWPHVGLYDEAAMPTVGDLLDLLARTAPDPDLQRRILVDNPARFYRPAGMT